MRRECKHLVEIGTDLIPHCSHLIRELMVIIISKQIMIMCMHSVLLVLPLLLQLGHVLRGNIVRHSFDGIGEQSFVSLEGYIGAVTSIDSSQILLQRLHGSFQKVCNALVAFLDSEIKGRLIKGTIIIKINGIRPTLERGPNRMIEDTFPFLTIRFCTNGLAPALSKRSTII